MKSREIALEEYVREIARVRNLILEDFARAYTAHLLDEYGHICMDDIELIQTNYSSEGIIKTTFSFEYKPLVE